MPRTKKQTDLRRSLDTDKEVTQEVFAELVGLTQQQVSKLCKYEVLEAGGTLSAWLREYDRFLRGMAYANKGWSGLAEAAGFGRSLGDDDI